MPYPPVNVNFPINILYIITFRTFLFFSYLSILFFLLSREQLPSISMALSMKRKSLLLSLLQLFLLSSMAAALKFRIGGEKGWHKPNDSESETYNEWARRNRFHIGDSLCKFILILLLLPLISFIMFFCCTTSRYSHRTTYHHHRLAEERSSSLAVGGALGEDSGEEQERGGGGRGVVVGDEDVLGGGEEGRGLQVGLQYSILWKTVSGEYHHPVLVSPNTVIQYRHPVPDRCWKHPVPHPNSPLI